MRITKYEHATLRIDDAGRSTIIDPGSELRTLGNPTDVDAVVITHEHPDHWTPEHVLRILESNPDAQVLAPMGVASAVAGAFPVTVIEPGDEAQAGAFRFRFFGGQHAVIHSSVPMIENVGVLVNDQLYYPGDSYAVPAGVEVDTLAAPAGAPWLKIGEAMDFVLAVQPRRCFQTHDATLSPMGLGFATARLSWATEQHGGEFTPLMPGESLSI